MPEGSVHWEKWVAQARNKQDGRNQSSCAVPPVLFQCAALNATGRDRKPQARKDLRLTSIFGGLHPMPLLRLARLYYTAATIVLEMLQPSQEHPP